jgi:predicted Fe-S protein YdhL (DUF1289 family)
MISPCVRSCCIDPASRLCTGCGRSLSEIGNWLGFTDDERRTIMAALAGRLARLAPARATPVRVAEKRADDRT